MSTPSAPRFEASPASGRMGWTALAISTLLACFYALFLGVERAFSLVTAPTWGQAREDMITGLSPFLLLAGFIALNGFAAGVPHLGVAFAVIGLLGSLLPGPIGPILGIPMLVAGLLYLRGHPEPRRLAVRIAVWAPVATGILTGLIVVIFRHGL